MNRGDLKQMTASPREREQETEVQPNSELLELAKEFYIRRFPRKREEEVEATTRQDLIRILKEDSPK